MGCAFIGKCIPLAINHIPLCELGCIPPYCKSRPGYRCRDMQGEDMDSVTALSLQADSTCTTESLRRRDRVVSLCFSSAALSKYVFVLCLWSTLQNQSCPWFSPVPASDSMTDFTSKDHNAPVSVTNYCSSTAPLWITVCTKIFKQMQKHLLLLS